ncbi:MAG TPA: 6-carboxytetrahydropterin synthase [Gemmatimonadales bacterium]|nr:6-carboxytetrahydropterin synthase [Gemmatimonadales bacterium]
MSVSLTRTVRFTARHRLWRSDWPPERNRAAFRAVADPHEHEYECAVTVAGPLDGRMGMIMDLGELDRILAEEVVAPLDGKSLNDDLPIFAGGAILPTCEALAAWLYGRIAPRLPGGVRLERVRVREDPTLHADCTGPA